MRADKLRELDNAELQRQEVEIIEQSFRLRFQMSMGQTDGVKKLQAIRKDRARILTILRERELHPETAPEPTSKAKKTKKKGK
ncbi:MAG TPA: 50S ribosomal protein L29 [Bryobacteraceae bacterium]|nr:50S ribosomal protein L29 [Bryobacteraceae bacterium]